ncbi:hypothetical protein [Marinobacter fonticola]|uniref:hypothetical protein n=1 Tax=Marinobacter fonticola TaxID=2603215 RepID=UPI0011E7BBBD|nr:hypothetical protein [Marinobacter fonticola]
MSIGKTGYAWLATALLALSGNGYAHNDHGDGQHAATKHDFSFKMGRAPGYFTEKCLPVNEGAEILYRFNSPYAVNFNVHVHTETETLFPVLIDNIDQHQASLLASDDQEYCFTWKTTAKAAETWVLNFSYELKN